MRGGGFEESISAKSAPPKDIYYPYGRIPEFTPDGSPLSIEGSGTRTDPYLLDTKSDFHYFSENIEEGAYYQQTANIDITGFTGIGNVDNIHYFGGRYALSGLVGSLFGRLRDSTVVGVRIINAYIGDTGGVAAVLNNSLLLSCSISGFVVCDVDSPIGGIVGTLQNSTIEDSYNNCVITAFEDGNIGGIVGDGNNSTVMYTYNSGSVRSWVGVVGGLVGDCSDIMLQASFNIGLICGNAQLAGNLPDMENILACYYGGYSTLDPVNYYLSSSDLAFLESERYVYDRGSALIGDAKGASIFREFDRIMLDFGIISSNENHYQNWTNGREGVYDGYIAINITEINYMTLYSNFFSESSVLTNEYASYYKYYISEPYVKLTEFDSNFFVRNLYEFKSWNTA